MAFVVTHVDDQEIHLRGENNTFRDEACILEAWEKARGDRNVNLLIEVHDDLEFVLRLFSGDVILPAYDQPIWSSKLIIGADIPKGIDPTQDIWMPIKRQIKELDRACRDLARCENIAKRSKSSERRNKAKAEKREHKVVIDTLTKAGWDTNGLFVTFIANRSVGASSVLFDLYTNGALREAIRDEIAAECPDKEPDSAEIEKRFAYRSAAAQRCVILQLARTINDLTHKKPLNIQEIQEVSMDFIDQLESQELDRIEKERTAARYAAKRP